MNAILEVRNRILHLCKELNYSTDELVELSGVCPLELEDILLARCHDIDLVTIMKLCDGLGITLCEFLSTPEFDKLRREIV